MDRQYVDSTMIIGIGYDSNTGTLEIEFKNSGANGNFLLYKKYLL